MADMRKIRFETKLIHAGNPQPAVDGAVTLPIFQSSTFLFEGEADYHDIRYLRLNNTPNHVSLHTKLAALEGGEAALVTASGMAAISTTLLTVLRTGDHVLAQQCLYGGTHDFLTTDLSDLGISFTLVDADDPASWSSQLRSETKAFYVESMTNPLVQIGDLKAVAAFARENGLTSIIDNTFASPVNYRPIEHGFDLVCHSATKYLNGHSDIVAGAVIGSTSWVERIRRKLNHLGGSLDPHACFLLNRGLKTLAVRVRTQTAGAVKVAQFLENRPEVSKVHYPGLETHASHARACEWFDGFGAMLSFELQGGAQAAQRFLDRVTLPLCAPSLGGVESLITRPATTSHVGMDPQMRRRAGIADGLIRLSVGLESTDDILEDFEQALKD